MKVVEIKKKDVVDPQEDVQQLLASAAEDVDGSQTDAVVIITRNASDGDVRYYCTGLTYLEILGMLQTTSYAVMLGDDE